MGGEDPLLEVERLQCKDMVRRQREPVEKFQEQMDLWDRDREWEHPERRSSFTPRAMPPEGLIIA